MLYIGQSVSLIHPACEKDFLDEVTQSQWNQKANYEWMEIAGTAGAPQAPPVLPVVSSTALEAKKTEQQLRLTSTHATHAISREDYGFSTGEECRPNNNCLSSGGILDKAQGTRLDADNFLSCVNGWPDNTMINQEIPYFTNDTTVLNSSRSGTEAISADYAGKASWNAPIQENGLGSLENPSMMPLDVYEGENLSEPTHMYTAVSEANREGFNESQSVNPETMDSSNDLRALGGNNSGVSSIEQWDHHYFGYNTCTFCGSQLSSPFNCDYCSPQFGDLQNRDFESYYKELPVESIKTPGDMRAYDSKQPMKLSADLVIPTDWCHDYLKIRLKCVVLFYPISIYADKIQLLEAIPTHFGRMERRWSGLAKARDLPIPQGSPLLCGRGKCCS